MRSAQFTGTLKAITYLTMPEQNFEVPWWDLHSLLGCWKWSLTYSLSVDTNMLVWAKLWGALMLLWLAQFTGMLKAITFLTSVDFTSPPGQNRVLYNVAFRGTWYMRTAFRGTWYMRTAFCVQWYSCLSTDYNISTWAKQVLYTVAFKGTFDTCGQLSVCNDTVVFPLIVTFPPGQNCSGALHCNTWRVLHSHPSVSDDTVVHLLTITSRATKANLFGCFPL